MALSGRLEDVSVADLVQFIHLGGRSGTLALEGDDGRAQIAFYRGQVVSARGRDGERLGDVLLEAGAINQTQLDDALAAQDRERPRRALGQLLVARGALDTPRLYEALTAHVTRTVGVVIAWHRGEFRFDSEEVALIDGLAMSPAELLPHVSVDTQMVLLDALRIFDEKNREAAREPTRGRAVESERRVPIGTRVERVATTALPAVHVVTPDPTFAESVGAALEAEQLRSTRVALRDAGTPRPREAAPIVIIDARLDGEALDSIAGLRRSRPRAVIVAVVAPREIARAFKIGADAALWPDAPAIAACTVALAQRHATLSVEEAIERRGFARLRRLLDDLRAGLVSATMSLQLMSVISERVDRAIFFMVRPDALVALGAFGVAADQRPLAVAMQGMTIERASAGMLDDCVSDGRAVSVDFADALFPSSLASVLGRPSTGQCVGFPVLATRDVIAVIYADNGGRDRGIDEIDILELATAQVGVVFENEVLRRKLLQRDG